MVFSIFTGIPQLYHSCHKGIFMVFLTAVVELSVFSFEQSVPNNTRWSLTAKSCGFLSKSTILKNGWYNNASLYPLDRHGPTTFKRLFSTLTSFFISNPFSRSSIET